MTADSVSWQQLFLLLVLSNLFKVCLHFYLINFLEYKI